MSNEAQGAQAAIKAIRAKGFFDVNGNKYQFSKMPFKKAKKIFAYLTLIAGELELGQLGFIDTPKFEDEIEPLLMQYMLVDGFKIDTVDEHFDENPSDYIEFVTTAIQGFAAPFLPEVSTASASKAKESQVTTLKKPM